MSPLMCYFMASISRQCCNSGFFLNKKQFLFCHVLGEQIAPFLWLTAELWQADRRTEKKKLNPLFGHLILDWSKTPAE